LTPVLVLAFDCTIATSLFLVMLALAELAYHLG
jgi:hypothetical protein